MVADGGLVEGPQVELIGSPMVIQWTAPTFNGANE